MSATHFMLIASCVLLVACAKDDDLEPTPAPTPAADILYTELDSTLKLTSVDTLIFHPSGCGMLPSPSDSSATRSIDVDNDGAADFTIACGTWYYFVSASGPCANYNTSMTITGASDERKISITNNYNTVARYAENDVIDNTQNWVSTATLMLSSATAPFSTNFNGTTYIGLKIGSDQGDRFAWLRLRKEGYVLTLYSHAIAASSTGQILAGQTE